MSSLGSRKFDWVVVVCLRDLGNFMPKVENQKLANTFLTTFTFLTSKGRMQSLYYIRKQDQIRRIFQL